MATRPKQKPQFFVGLSIGMLLAIPVGTAIFGNVLYDYAATLWGSALGAIAAVGGAFWVTSHQQGQAQKVMARLVSTIYKDPVWQLTRLCELHGKAIKRADSKENDTEPDEISSNGWADIRFHAQNLRAHIQAAGHRIKRAEPCLHSLGAKGLQALHDLEDEFHLLDFTINEIIQRADRTETKLYGNNPSHISRTAMEVHRVAISKAATVLKVLGKE